MPEPREEEFTANVDVYREKMRYLRTREGRVPEPLMEVSVKVAEKMTDKWLASFGRYHKIWKRVVTDVLKPKNVDRLEYAKYRAFVNAYLSKVVKQGWKPETIKSTWVDLYKADHEIIDAIENVIKTGRAEEEL